MADDECDGCGKLRNGMARKGGERRVEASRGGEGRASEHGAEDRQGAGRGPPSAACTGVSKGSSSVWQGGAMWRPILKAATYLRNTHSKSTDDFLVPRIRTPIIKAT